ncbi:MAG: spore maturation protein CgeB [Paracoccaceae bacterium]|jgi:spore maturation protein CgeB
MFSGLRILLIADLNAYSKGLGRARALHDMDVQTTDLSHTASGGADGGFASISTLDRILWKLGIQKDATDINRRLIDAAKELVPDIVWIEKGNMIRPSTLRALRRIVPEATLVSYSEDDMFLAHNRTRAYLKGLPHYDCVFTTKAPNVDVAELPALGARRVIAVDKAYDPHVHYPIEVSESDVVRYGADVGFVGSYEEARARSLAYLAKNGITVRVWGNGWEACSDRPAGLNIEGRAVVNTERELGYTKALCATRINLGFLRKLNRDTQTDRTVELPACGAFMLAERSDDHRRLFKEGQEAAFFGTDEEMLEKVRYYLAHDQERAAIAGAARQRCLDSGYSETERMRRMISACRA